MGTTNSSTKKRQASDLTDESKSTRIDPNTKALEKLEDIQKNLTKLNEQVEAFSGSTREDRHYKELDEQAVKLMMRCDELIDVGTDIKEKRREMIRNVQTILATLESKVPQSPTVQENSKIKETSLTTTTTTAATAPPPTTTTTTTMTTATTTTATNESIDDPTAESAVEH